MLELSEVARSTGGVGSGSETTEEAMASAFFASLVLTVAEPSKNPKRGTLAYLIDKLLGLVSNDYDSH